jgi:small GTP-binding protein
LPIGLADLADALRHLNPDAEGLRAIAHALGMRAISARPREDAQPPILPDFDRPPDERKEPPREPESPSQSRRSARGLNVEVVKLASRRDSIPAAVRRATPLAISDEMLHPAPAPLLRPQQARTFLQDHAGQLVPMAAIDVDAAIEQLARLRLFALPREHRKGFRRGVSVVFDESPGMEPFRDDVDQLRDAVQRFAGPHVIATCDVSRSPNECDVASLARAGTVLLITDLGLGRLRGTQRSWTEDWIDLSKRLARAGRRVVAIVPYGPKRWPQRTEIEITHWNDSTEPQNRDSASEVEQLARALSIAGRIDPALVRSARRSLFPGFDPGLEGDFLFSPLLEVSTSRAVVFHDEELHRLRDEIAKRPFELENARRFLAAYRQTVGPKSVALEEDIVYFALRQSRGDRKEIEQRIASIVRTMLDRADDFDLARWASGVYAELPAWARELKLSESLDQAASVRLGRPLARVKSWLLPSEPIVAGIAREGDSLVIREPREAGDPAITVPATNPRVVIAGDEIVQFGAGQPGRIAAPSLPLQLETLDGARFRVIAAEGRALAPGIDWIESIGGSAGPVNAIAFDPSGRLFATANDNGQVELWNIATSQFVGSLHGHSGRVHCVVFDRAGDMLASGASDGKVLVRETRSGMFDRELLGRHDGDVLSLSFDEYGHLASGGGDETIRIWSTTPDEGPLRTLKVHQGPVQTVAFNHSGPLLAHGSIDGRVEVTDPANETIVRELTGSSPAVAFSPDGQLLATATLQGAIRISKVAPRTEASDIPWIFEGHVAEVETLSFSHDGRFLASLDATGQLRIWDCATGACLAVIPSSPMHRVVAFHPTRNELATVGIGPGSDPSRVDLWSVDPSTIGVAEMAAVYTDAKIVLLGDTGVGKSGLALALAEKRFQMTESTHASNVYRLDLQEIVERNQRTVREAILWDLAGQPDYRLLNQLHLDDVAVAILVFDARSETDPLAGVRYWDRALRHANPNRRVRKLLVAARTDVGRVGLSRDRIQSLVRDLEFDGFFETSAKEGRGVDELRAAILNAIEWGELPRTMWPEVVVRMRSFVMALKGRGKRMSAIDVLVEEFSKANPDVVADLRPLFDICLGSLERHDLIRRLTVENLVLLQPELLDATASALIAEARNHPDGMGAITERAAFSLYDDPQLAQAAIEELVRLDLATWERTEAGRYLVFPSAVTRESSASPDPDGVAVTIYVSGSILSIYATLVVRLSLTNIFTSYELWRNAATFKDPVGAWYGVSLEQSDFDRASLQIFFDPNASSDTRAVFERYVIAHLESRATAGSVEVIRAVLCPNCGTRVPDNVVAQRKRDGKDFAFCSSCGLRVPFEPGQADTAKKIVRIGVLSSITKLDPRDAVDNISGMVLDQIFEAPYALPAGESAVRPQLLDLLKPEGPLQYSAAVRSGIRFSDGTPLTAEIVARSLRETRFLASKANVSVQGDRVWFSLRAPNPRFDLTLTQGNCAIVLERNGQFLGTGPFMFEQKPNLRMLQNAKTITLVRNPHHHDTTSVDEAQFVICPAETDGSPRMLLDALRQGQVDITTAVTMAELMASQIPGVAPSLQPGNSTGILFFNTERPLLADANIRRGIALALDVSEIAAVSYDKNPMAFVAPSLLPPMMGRSVGMPTTDHKEARRLFASANDAEPSRLTLLVPWAPRPYLPKPLPVANAIQQQLEDFGIAIDLVKPTTSDDFFNDLIRGNYDLALAGWIADTPDPADFFEALLWSKMCEGENHSNHSRWKHPPMDAALAKFRDLPTEENKREIHRLVREEAPLVPLIYGQSVIVHSRKIRNVNTSATGVLSLAGIKL